MSSRNWGAKSTAPPARVDRVGRRRSFSESTLGQLAIGAVLGAVAAIGVLAIDDLLLGDPLLGRGRIDEPLTAVGIGALIGTLLGVLSAWLRHPLRQRLSPADQKRLQLPNPIGAPFAKPHELRRLSPDRRSPIGLVLDRPESALAATFRDVLARIDQMPSQAALGVAVLVTAPHAGVGATTLATCLSAVAAASGRRVLLIDADLRNRGATQLLDVDSKTGIHEAAVGAASLDHVLVGHDVYAFDMAPASASRVGGRELYSAVLWPNILAQTRARYDLIVIDAPPTLEGVEARMLARMADATLLAGRRGKTPTLAVAAAANALRQNARSAPILACVLTDAPTEKDKRVRR